MTILVRVRAWRTRSMTRQMKGSPRIGAIISSGERGRLRPASMMATITASRGGPTLGVERLRVVHGHAAPIEIGRRAGGGGDHRLQFGGGGDANNNAGG